MTAEGHCAAGRTPDCQQACVCEARVCQFGNARDPKWGIGHPRLLSFHFFSVRRRVFLESDDGLRWKESYRRRLQNSTTKRTIYSQPPSSRGTAVGSQGGVSQLPALFAIAVVTTAVSRARPHIGETLAQSSDVAVHTCPVPVDTFAVRQHRHARYHHEAGNRWLRVVVAKLFGGAR